VLYAYHETENAHQNLDFFVRQGVHSGADFFFIINGAHNASQLLAPIADRHNVHIVERENTCFDLGAYGEVLLKNKLWKKYKRFIMVNASMRGPFIPTWSTSCWTDAFFSKLNDRVKVRPSPTVLCSPKALCAGLRRLTDLP
jgi:hypothetical protein